MAAASSPRAPPTPTPLPRPLELVLLGGGHAQIEVLRRLPEFDPRVRVTLVAREVRAPYSGMLPGVVAGFYARREAHIDLRALAQARGGGRCRVVRGEAAAVDVPGRRVLVRRTAEDEGAAAQPLEWMPYDLLSINVGIEPEAAAGPAAGPAAAAEEVEENEDEGKRSARVTPVKPISSFLSRWEDEVLPRARRALEARAAQEEEEQEQRDGGSARPAERRLFRVAVVGGGAGGVELAFAVAQRLSREWERAWRRLCRRRRRRQEAGTSAPRTPPPPPVRVTLYSRGPILPGAPAAARAKFLRLASPDGAAASGSGSAAGLVRIRESEGGVTAVERGGTLRLGRRGGEEEEEEAPFDACLWCTQAAAPGWFASPPSRGLPLDARGFLRTRATLQLFSPPPPAQGGGGGEEGAAAAAAAASSSPSSPSALDDVFAAGDASSIEGHPRPKAGVYAVRAGPFLAENLRRRSHFLAEASAAAAAAAAAETPPSPPPLLAFLPQRRALALISAGAGWALAARPPLPLCPGGAWAWAWKDRIDRAFVRRYDPAAGAARGGGDDDESDDDGGP